MRILRKKKIFNIILKELCKLPSVSSQRYGLNTLSFRGSLLWNTIDDEIKYHHFLKYLKRKYVAGMALTVHVLFAINLVLFLLIG